MLRAVTPYLLPYFENRLQPLIRFTPRVGMYVAQFVKSLTERFNLTLDKTAMAGHSLGAHSGWTQPLPLFSLADTNNRLDPTDAKYVHVIHTCGGMLGFMAPIGHADYYPNGGSSQPGCLLDVTGVCAHARSFFYFAESIAPITKTFVSKQCSTYKDYKKGKCKSNPRSIMGDYPVDKGANGRYYLDTNKQPPYAQAIKFRS
ncbi:hypothetical protein NQ317_008579 [Molorchus minor]|uniref:Lipase domain-containing protein n=1 Tax=Molorchus minor TaxID=1323400 RepID=A0ABQ9J3A2_9CUCU|nr:hypothetical protein NQ317_008579 [Molorchus minor]